MATVTQPWFTSNALTVSVTFNNANGAVGSVSVTNNSDAPITGSIEVAGKAIFSHTFAVGTTSWNVPNGWNWGVDTPTFTAWWE